MKKIAALAKKLITTLGGIADLRDAHAYGGLAMFGYGVHLYAPWAAFALCGLVLFWIGVRR